MGIRIKDWHKFQHFKDRRPPWVKLYRDLLDDLEWHDLDPVAAKALVMLWLIASEHDGALPEVRVLAFRLRVTEADCNLLIGKLSHWLESDDNAAISERYQGDAPERETERETETEKNDSAPRKSSKPKAKDPTLAQWIASLDGDAVPADDPLFGWAEKQGIPAAWLAYAWAAFEDRYVEKPDKVQADWRSAFRNHVKRGWLDVWRHDQRTGGFVLTTAGEQWRRECEA